MTADASTLFRYLTLLLGMVNLVWVLLRLAVYWEQYRRDFREYKIVLAIYILMVNIGVLQTFFNDDVHLPRFLYIGTDVANILLIVVLYRNRGGPIGNKMKLPPGSQWP